MSSKTIIRYVCQECGTSHNKWGGRCEGCGEWNILVEEAVSKAVKKAAIALSNEWFVDLSQTQNSTYQRHASGLEEFDRVCGGGLVPGSVILVGGDPGIGKSTLLLQLSVQLSKTLTSAYVSGEESIEQLQMRAQRLQLKSDNLKLAVSNNLEEIIVGINSNKDIKLVIIDSIQTVASNQIDGACGTVSQVRFCAQQLLQIAKKQNIIVILVGHVTKEGILAGPRVLEHMVDTVLYFEGDKSYDFRLLRTVKNRFGANNEIGIFTMGEEGLQEVANPSALFLSHTEEQVPGVAIFAGIEGTRPILCEIQALIAPTYFGAPRRTTVGLDSNRLAMIIAVLESRCNLNLGNKDVYLNVAGGLKITEPAADLAVAAALISAIKKSPNLKNWVYCGEISLSGEVRPVAHQQLRLKEAEKLGFIQATCGKGNYKSENFKINEISHLSQLIK